MMFVRRMTIDRATVFGVYPISSQSFRIRLRVSLPISELPDSARETVAYETPATFATSFSVTIKTHPLIETTKTFSLTLFYMVLTGLSTRQMPRAGVLRP